MTGSDQDIRHASIGMRIESFGVFPSRVITGNLLVASTPTSREDHADRHPSSAAKSMADRICHVLGQLHPAC